VTIQAATIVGRRRGATDRPTSGKLIPAVACGVIVLLALVALLAPWIAPQNPNAVNLFNAYASPSGAHLLGADASGRDLLSRLMWGSRTALLGPLVIVGSATIAGSLLALVSSWNRGPIDTFISRALDIVFAFPGLLLAILASATFGFGLTSAVAALSISYTPYIARVVRSEALRQRGLPYVDAGLAQGYPGIRMALRHLLPNLLPLIIGQVTVSFGYAMVDLSAVSYLGLGVQPPTADWGAMVSTGQNSILAGHPQESLYAGACIVLAVVSFTLLGDYITARAELSAR
jgi:peptide/nickel transport system permease protein